jgi:redox-sensitive bicupin YhaK (pirin superfamily)
MTIQIYSPKQQAVGSFDGGKMTEQKPIGFPGEGSAVKRVGALFYWAWFHAKSGGSIPMHPHRGFEIITYVLQGSVGHRDTLGTESDVGAGGAQVMQTGSGVSHAEYMGPETSGFQIWFEPYLGEALRREPTYAQYEHADFPIAVSGGVTVKTIIGEGAPVQLVVNAQMRDVTITKGAKVLQVVPSGYSLTGLVIEGNMNWIDSSDSITVPNQYFAVFAAEEDVTIEIAALEEENARAVLILVPTELGYLPYNRLNERNI